LNNRKIVVSGVFLKGNEARVITLSGKRSDSSVIASKFHKLQLAKNPSQDDVEVFKQVFLSYCLDNNIESVIINRRAVSGLGAGGAMTFIIEGILLAISKIPIEFVHPATIKATDKREIKNKSNRPNTVALGKAYDLAYEGLF